MKYNEIKFINNLGYQYSNFYHFPFPAIQNLNIFLVHLIKEVYYHQNSYNKKYVTHYYQYSHNRWQVNHH